MLPEHRKQLKQTPNFPNSLYTKISNHPKFCFFLIFLLIPYLAISITRNSPPCPPQTAAKSAQDCPYGKIYVYDLPSQFNEELLWKNCTDLNPWRWQCGISPNHGFGGRAVELRGLLPDHLSESWYRTNQFSLEKIFHHRILNHHCRTLEPQSAAAFYIPFYAGLAVGEYLWINDDVSKRDIQCNELLQWVTNQTTWRKSNGSDHFTAISRITWDFRRLTDAEQKWGSTFLNMPDMQNVTRFIIEKAPFDDHDIGVPYPTGFHPETRDALTQWQDFARDYNRTRLFTFIGATREGIDNDFRGILFNYCKNQSDDSCRLVDCAVSQCSSDSSVTLEAFLGSDFCLQPKGDSYTRRSVFDCMLGGSVPVFFWKQTAYDQYHGFLPGEPESYSVYLDHEEVIKDINVVKEVLMRFSKEEIRKKREKVIENIPRIIYGMSNGGLRNFKDGFDIAVEGVLERIKAESEWSEAELA